MQLNFVKMDGAGNDFVVIDNRDGSASLDRQTIARLCNRNRGIGGDGLLAVEIAQGEADFRMRYYNADGGEAEMCGNGARCFARFASRLGETKERVSFETMAGIITAELVGEDVRLEMSPPTDLATGLSLRIGDALLPVNFVNTGVPHAVAIVSDLDSVDVRTAGAALRYHEHFAPRGTNANFVQWLEDGTLRIRTYERGVEDETLACGTGVVAAALVANRLHQLPSPVKVMVKGGEVLEVAFEEEAATYSRVTLTGPAEFVFEGTVQV